MHCVSGSALPEKSLNWVCKEEALREGILTGRSGSGVGTINFLFWSYIHHLDGDWMQYIVCCLLRRTEKGPRIDNMVRGKQNHAILPYYNMVYLK